MNKKHPNDLITVTEARKLLNVSANKMAQLIKEGAIRYFTHPLDKRKKLVSRAEITGLQPSEVRAA